MLYILVIGIAVSAVIAYLARKSTRLVGVTGVLNSQGFSEDAVEAIDKAPGDAVLTITLEGGETFTTTAAEAANRLRLAPDGKSRTWLLDSSSNGLSLILFAAGCALSVYLYILSKPGG